ncbi:hypothetical protein EJD97_020570 [Solanum chilense]|uniref:Uncharacterized protein n=1 Tax=Solanum chilense TaxID=4083 RepID=A0A6N2C649_SOLCI|nr:hypothetical protein EJD97_020570 [Solanum chilense]
MNLEIALNPVPKTSELFVLCREKQKFDLAGEDDIHINSINKYAEGFHSPADNWYFRCIFCCFWLVWVHVW